MHPRPGRTHGDHMYLGEFPLEFACLLLEKYNAGARRWHVLCIILNSWRYMLSTGKWSVWLQLRHLDGGVNSDSKRGVGRRLDHARRKWVTQRNMHVQAPDGGGKSPMSCALGSVFSLHMCVLLHMRTLVVEMSGGLYRVRSTPHILRYKGIKIIITHAHYTR